MVALDGLVYAIGGFDAARAIVARVEAFDPSAGTWKARAPLPRPVHHAHAAVVGGKIYVAGALEGAAFKAIGATLEYDPTGDAWTPRASMPAGTERGGGGAAALGGRIYVVGGLRGGASVADFSAYDPAMDAWEILPPMPAARDHLVAAAAGGIVFAVGGRAGGVTGLVGRVDGYDPVARSWTPRKPMITARGGTAAAVLAGRVVVAGGEGNTGASSGVFPQVEGYDPAADVWAALAPMKTPRHGTGAAVVGDRLYVPGGATVQGFGAVATVESFGF